MNDANGVARIMRHPTDSECVLIKSPAALNNEFGRFQPASLSHEHRAFIIHNDAIPAFYRFARMISLHVIDERKSRTVSQGERTQPAECESCGQPGSVGNPPAVCPTCGETWVPAPPPVNTISGTLTECGKCRHKQGGRFMFCAQCGHRMDYAKPTPPPEPIIRQRSRPNLVDPMAIGDMLPAREARTVPPWEPRYLDERPVETVDLPPAAPEPDDEGGGW